MDVVDIHFSRTTRTYKLRWCEADPLDYAIVHVPRHCQPPWRFLFRNRGSPRDALTRDGGWSRTALVARRKEIRWRERNTCDGRTARKREKGEKEWARKRGKQHSVGNSTTPFIRMIRQARHTIYTYKTRGFYTAVVQATHIHIFNNNSWNCEKEQNKDTMTRTEHFRVFCFFVSMFFTRDIVQLSPNRKQYRVQRIDMQSLKTLMISRW